MGVKCGWYGLTCKHSNVLMFVAISHLFWGLQLDTRRRGRLNSEQAECEPNGEASGSLNSERTRLRHTPHDTLSLRLFASNRHSPIRPNTPVAALQSCTADLSKLSASSRPEPLLRRVYSRPTSVNGPRIEATPMGSDSNGKQIQQKATRTESDPNRKRPYLALDRWPTICR